MPTFLTQEWLDLAVERSGALPEAAGRSARIRFVVPGAPDGEVKLTTVVADGRVVEGSVGADGEADLTLTITYPEALALLNGELDPNAAFMRGRIKVSGPTGPLLDLLALARAPERVAARAALAEATST